MLRLADCCPQAWLSVREAKEAAEEAGAAPPPATVVTGVWKFNKNTQAWLLRHVFSDDQVSTILYRHRGTPLLLTDWTADPYP